MGIATIPSAGGGGIKSVQRGSAGGAGTVTITAVDITKSFVNVFGTASSGTVAASATIPALNGTKAASNISGFYRGYTGRPGGSGPGSNPFNWTDNSANISLNSGSLSGGSNNLVAAVVQGYLSNSTSLVVSGACRWEVVEFN